MRPVHSTHGQGASLLKYPVAWSRHTAAQRTATRKMSRPKDVTSPKSARSSSQTAQNHFYAERMCDYQRLLAANGAHEPLHLLHLGSQTRSATPGPLDISPDLIGQHAKAADVCVSVTFASHHGVGRHVQLPCHISSTDIHSSSAQLTRIDNSNAPRGSVRLSRPLLLAATLHHQIVERRTPRRRNQLSCLWFPGCPAHLVR